MRVTGSPGVSGALPAAALLTVVFLVNAAEFSGLLGTFPGYGMLGVFGLAVVGGASVVAAVALALVPVGGVSRATTARLLAFGGVLLVGCVPLYLTFGCVFYGCVG